MLTVPPGVMVWPDFGLWLHTMFCWVQVLLNWTFACRPFCCNSDFANVTDWPTRSGMLTGGPWAPVTRVTLSPLFTVVPLAGTVRNTSVSGVEVADLSTWTDVLRPLCCSVCSALPTFWLVTSGRAKLVLAFSPMCHQPTEFPRKMMT